MERSGFVESRHAGSAVVLSPEGEILASYGNISAPVLPRSSMKPLQSLACATAGLDLTGEALALSTASHSGTDRHVAVVRGMLQSVGLTEDDLECPVAYPSDTETYAHMLRDALPQARVRMNCSGKHAAMLMTCVANEWPTAGYLDPQHPLQIHTRELIERLTGEKMTITAVDGCGAPVYGMSLHGLARALHRIGTASERSPFAMYRAAGALVRAVRENPWAISGPGRDDAIAIETLGVFSKVGAEGVQVMVAPNGTTVALKMLDGNPRANAIVAATLLAHAGALTEAQVAELESALNLAVLGAGQPVGRIRVTAAVEPAA